MKNETAKAEQDFVAWKSPIAIAEEYGLADRMNVYRHANAHGLFEKRRRNIRAALEHHSSRRNHRMKMHKNLETDVPPIGDRLLTHFGRPFSAERSRKSAEKARRRNNSEVGGSLCHEHV